MYSKSFTCGLKLYLSGIFVYAFGILLFNFLPYYQSFLSPETNKTLLYLFLAYALLSPIYYLAIPKHNSQNIIPNSKPYLFIQAIKKYFISFFKQDKYDNNKITKDEKVAVLFIAVKLFFLPTMINFFYTNFDIFVSFILNFSWSQWFAISFTGLFMLDTLIFSFGYTFESSLLKNKVKSVEPTLLGWLVAIICYPPFNHLFGNLIPWGANDYVEFGSSTLTTIMRIFLVFLLIIYVMASVALFTKASNLTNRGIVSRFPYSIVRHPAYISKVMLWWVTLLPVNNIPFALGMLVWSVIYFMRAITEEKHLGQDEEYQKYCKKVKYKFIPYVY